MCQRACPRQLAGLASWSEAVPARKLTPAVRPRPRQSTPPALSADAAGRPTAPETAAPLAQDDAVRASVTSCFCRGSRHPQRRAPPKVMVSVAPPQPTFNDSVNRPRAPGTRPKSVAMPRNLGGRVLEVIGWVQVAAADCTHRLLQLTLIHVAVPSMERPRLSPAPTSCRTSPLG